MIPFFKNTKIDLYAYDGKDEYGDNVYTYRETIDADLQPLSNHSSMEIFGKILQDTYNAYINSQINIKETDRLMIEDNSYEIVGSVENWNHMLNFQKCIIKKLRR